MGKAYTNPIYEYDRSPDQFSAAPTHHPVIIVGAGPAGLSAAIDLAVMGFQQSCLMITIRLVSDLERSAFPSDRSRSVTDMVQQTEC